MTQVQLREGEEFPKLPKESADLIVSCMHMHVMLTLAVLRSSCAPASTITSSLREK